MIAILSSVMIIFMARTSIIYLSVLVFSKNVRVLSCRKGGPSSFPNVVEVEHYRQISARRRNPPNSNENG